MCSRDGTTSCGGCLTNHTNGKWHGSRHPSRYFPISSPQNTWDASIRNSSTVDGPIVRRSAIFLATSTSKTWCGYCNTCFQSFYLNVKCSDLLLSQCPVLHDDGNHPGQIVKSLHLGPLSPSRTVSLRIKAIISGITLLMAVESGTT